MTDLRASALVARYTPAPEGRRRKGACGLACGAFAAVLGCAFWAGAVFASAPWPH